MTTFPPTAPTTNDESPAAGEHLLTIVEPSGRGDTTLDIARDVVARGGRASIVMVITDRVDDDIRNFAASEELSRGEAEAHAIDQLTAYCSERVGDDVPTIVERFGRLGTDIRRYITDEVTAVAVPEGFLSARGANKLSRRVGRPVVVASDRAA